MKLIKEQLEVEVKRIAELDQKRTQGDWKPLQSQSYCEPSPAEFYYGILAYTGDVYKCGIVDSEGTDLTNYPNAPHDFAFIAHAPQMAQIIRQLWEERQNGIPIAKLDGMVEVAVKGYFEREDKGYARDTVYDYIKAAINAIKQEAGE